MAERVMNHEHHAVKSVPHDIDDPVTQDVLRRLKNIEGQIRGLQKMVEGDKYCIDILTQMSAVRSALNSAGMKLLRRHLDTCVTEEIRNGGESKAEMIDELMTIVSRQGLE